MTEIDAGQILLAFKNGEFFHAYQPVLDLETGTVPYVEALIRWAHPVHGVLNPGAFLALVHGAGLSDELTDFGLRDILSNLPELRVLYGEQIAVAVNLSHRQLQNPDTLPDRVRTALEDAGETPAALAIEVVEDLTSSDIMQTRGAFRELRELGVNIMLDDFGTGASSLTALTDLEYDGLKIDRTFVRGLTSSSVARSVVEAVLTFGGRFKISIIAEGVETALELQALKQLGCTLAQGYLLGRPEPIAEGAQHLGYVPVAPTPPIEEQHSVDVGYILDRVRKIDPRSLQPFEDMRAELEHLDAQLTSGGRGASLVRCEIGTRMALAAMYAGEHDLLITWAVRTSHLAESIESWGYSATALSLIANCSQLPADSAGLRIDALVRALEIRATKPIEEHHIGPVDNGIGSAFAHLQLWEHARSWWTESVARHGDVDQISSALCHINLCDLEINQIEDEISPTDRTTPVELSIAFCEQILARVRRSKVLPPSLVPAMTARLQLVGGDIDGAADTLAGIDEVRENTLSRFQLNRSRARLAQAQGRHEEFHGYTTELVEALRGHELLAVHDWRAQRLHADALLAVGRVDEAAQLLRTLVDHQSVEESKRLLTMFDWVRLNADLNVRFTELADGPSSTPLSL